MNTAVTSITAMEAVGTVRQQQKTNAAAEPYEFSKMLTESLNNPGNTDTAQKTETANTETAKTQTKDNKPQKDAAPAVTETKVAESESEEEIDPAIAAAAIQIIQQPESIVDDVSINLVTDEVNAIMVQGIDAKAEQTTVVQTQTAEFEVPAATVEDPVQVQPTDISNAQTTIGNEQIMGGAEAAATQTATVNGVPAAKQAQTETEAENIPQVQVLQIETAPDETSKIVSGETEEDLTPVETAPKTAEPETAKTPKDAAQNRFDMMIAKATEELGQNKTVTPKAPEGKDIEIENEQLPEGQIKQQDIAEQEAPIEAEPKTAEPKTAAKTTVISKEQAPKTEQRQEKEISNTDEATLGLAGSKQPEIRMDEPVRSEPTRYSQQVNTPDQAEQIKAQVIKSIENDKMEFEMQLHPQELGKVDVKMVLESGRLSVEIIAANTKSTEMLTKQAESLIASLKANNIEVSSVNVVTAGQNASGHMDGQFNLNNFQNQQQAHEQRGYGQNRTHSKNRGAADDTVKVHRQMLRPLQGRLNYAI